jgi:DNA integrity scanning protein DisA with diadenylate cyclase activity
MHKYKKASIKATLQNYMGKVNMKGKRKLLGLTFSSHSIVCCVEEILDVFVISRVVNRVLLCYSINITVIRKKRQRVALEELHQNSSGEVLRSFVESFFRPHIQSWNPATGCGA